MRKILLLLVFALNLISPPAFAGWKRPLGIVMTSIGGVGFMAGSVMLASPDSCRPDNKTDECRRDKQKKENQRTPVLLTSASLLAGGIVLIVNGGDKRSNSNGSVDGMNVGLAISKDRSPLISLATVW